jgi:hypothetical protein
MDVHLILPGLTRGDLARHLLRNNGKANIPFERGVPVATCSPMWNANKRCASSLLVLP